MLRRTKGRKLQGKPKMKVLDWLQKKTEKSGNIGTRNLSKDRLSMIITWTLRKIQ